LAPLRLYAVSNEMRIEANAKCRVRLDAEN
jgi:hypothetical protein